MALKKKVAAGTALHYPNLDKKAPGDAESGSVIKNHQEAQDLLVDPQDDLDGSSTHTPVVASADLDEDLDISDLSEVDSMYEEEDEGDAEEEEGLGSILDDSDDAATDELLEDEDALEDLAEEEGGNPEDEVPVEGESIEEQEFAAEGIPLVDIDEVDDAVEDADEELAMASIGASLHVIRANRIIASMTKKQALKASKEDIYLDDAFASVVNAEVQSQGLRKGLTSLGFQLATVATTKDQTIRAEVSAKVAAVKVNAANAVKAERQALQQSFAIASVGMSRKFFKDVKNDLRAGLEQELSALGIRNANKLVASLFARHGISYANSLFALATKIAAMPEETRDQFSEALDLTDSDFVEDASDDQEEGVDDFDPDADDLDAPATVSAALSRPLHSVVARDSRPSRSQSVTAASVLSGEHPLPFAM